MNTQKAARRAYRAQRFETWVRDRVVQRGAFPFLVTAILTLALGAGVLARIIDPDDFDSFGDAICGRS